MILEHPYAKLWFVNVLIQARHGGTMKHLVTYSNTSWSGSYRNSPLVKKPLRRAQSRHAPSLQGQSGPFGDDPFCNLIPQVKGGY